MGAPASSDEEGYVLLQPMQRRRIGCSRTSPSSSKLAGRPRCSVAAAWPIIIIIVIIIISIRTKSTNTEKQLAQ